MLPKQYIQSTTYLLERPFKTYSQQKQVLLKKKLIIILRHPHRLDHNVHSKIKRTNRKLQFYLILSSVDLHTVLVYKTDW